MKNWFIVAKKRQMEKKMAKDTIKKLWKSEVETQIKKINALNQMFEEKRFEYKQCQMCNYIRHFSVANLIFKAKKVGDRGLIKNAKKAYAIAQKLKSSMTCGSCQRNLQMQLIQN